MFGLRKIKDEIKDVWMKVQMMDRDIGDKAVHSEIIHLHYRIRSAEERISSLEQKLSNFSKNESYIK